MFKSLSTIPTLYPRRIPGIEVRLLDTPVQVMIKAVELKGSPPSSVATPWGTFKANIAIKQCLFEMYC